MTFEVSALPPTDDVPVPSILSDSSSDISQVPGLCWGPGSILHVFALGKHISDLCDSLHMHKGYGLADRSGCQGPQMQEKMPFLICGWERGNQVSPPHVHYTVNDQSP